MSHETHMIDLVVADVVGWFVKERRAATVEV